MRWGKRFEFLEHTADVYIVAYGATLEEAFENAALATFEVMTDVRKIAHKIEDTVKVEASDEQALLYSWLEQLLVNFETKGNLYSDFRISKIEKTKDGFMFTARIRGEPFNPAKHPQKVGIKAVTYHRMEIDKKPGRVSVKFILDI
ncbi:MAG TPA: archease [Candidatus Krumholzibacteriaceae bacterium]|nr:archease [Candidatus Krumholzibacteriaceae bacterium]